MSTETPEGPRGPVTVYNIPNQTYIEYAEAANRGDRSWQADGSRAARATQVVNTQPQISEFEQLFGNARVPNGIFSVEELPGSEVLLSERRRPGDLFGTVKHVQTAIDTLHRISGSPEEVERLSKALVVIQNQVEGTMQAQARSGSLRQG